MPGVSITTTEGSPDAEVKIRVRGGGSLSQDNSPLYIVDGFPVSSISDIASADIESIDVLKDASSTAIYGAKGANGVIIITTKSGHEGSRKSISVHLRHRSDIFSIKPRVNLYDSAGQTDDTISPHYYVNGVPSSTTQFDNSYHCTAKIEVEPSTAYWLGLVPAQGGYTKPWADASYGVFFYDEDGDYISGTTSNSFTTPAGAKYLRFNYAFIRG